MHLMHMDECFRESILQNNLSFFRDGKQILNKLQMFLAHLKYSFMKVFSMLYWFIHIAFWFQKLKIFKSNSQFRKAKNLYFEAAKANYNQSFTLTTFIKSFDNHVKQIWKKEKFHKNSILNLKAKFWSFSKMISVLKLAHMCLSSI